MTALVLASSSPRRLALLAQIGVVPASVASPDVDEAVLAGERPADHALRLAIAKAQAVSPEPGNAVLAGDTCVAAGRRILPKAETEAMVGDCLRLLSGRRHHVFSAIAVIDANGRIRTRLSRSIVIFKRLEESEIASYAACGEGLGKAGGYAIQGRAAGLIRDISGSHSGIVGLPLYETRALLRAAGVPLG